MLQFGIQWINDIVLEYWKYTDYWKMHILHIFQQQQQNIRGLLNICFKISIVIFNSVSTFDKIQLQSLCWTEPRFYNYINSD